MVVMVREGLLKKLAITGSLQIIYYDQLVSSTVPTELREVEELGTMTKAGTQKLHSFVPLNKSASEGIFIF